MARELACGDIVAGCEFKASAAGEAELMKLVVEHAVECHGEKEFTADLAAKVKAAIKER